MMGNIGSVTTLVLLLILGISFVLWGILRSGLFSSNTVNVLSTIISTLSRPFSRIFSNCDALAMEPADRICLKEKTGFEAPRGNDRNIVTRKLDLSSSLKQVQYRTLVRIAQKTHEVLGRYHPCGHNCFPFTNTIMKAAEILSGVEARHYVDRARNLGASGPSLFLGNAVVVVCLLVLRDH